VQYFALFYCSSPRISFHIPPLRIDWDKFIFHPAEKANIQYVYELRSLILKTLKSYCKILLSSFETLFHFLRLCFFFPPRYFGENIRFKKSLRGGKETASYDNKTDSYTPTPPLSFTHSEQISKQMSFSFFTRLSK